MRPFNLFLFAGVVLSLFASCTFQPRAEWVVTTDSIPWMRQPDVLSASLDTIPVIDVTVCTDEPQQRIDGFGACFSELGWLSLNKLAPVAREDIMQELFYPGEGTNFTLCRTPLGANEFSRDWYSYDETEGDYEMNDFTVANDLQTLIPFIRNAQKYQPDLRVWASPWSPPSWLMRDKACVCDSAGLQGYALYFSRFIDAYKEQGIPVFAVMPQTEWNTAHFIGQYLGPALQGKEVDILFGTTGHDGELRVDSLLSDSLCRPYIKGIGVQQMDRGAVATIHKRHPKMKLYQTEQESGDGKNDWKSAMYAWNLMQRYLNNGVSAYMYRHIALDEGGMNRWGRAQNSLVVVDPEHKTYRYTPEYFVMKHVSHYVQPGARRLLTDGAYTNLLAFRNPDKSIVVVIANETSDARIVSIRVEGRVYQPSLAAHSLSTLFID